MKIYKQMKKIILGLTLVLGAGMVSVQAQNGANTTAAKPVANVAAAAAISFTEKDNTFDFGTIPQGTPVTHVFYVKNTGKAPLVLTNVAPSCGCTTPEWPKDPIKPGATAPIKVTYNAASPGTFTKNITVNSNATVTPTTVLYIKGEVKPVEQAVNGGPAVQSAGPKKN